MIDKLRACLDGIFSVVYAVIGTLTDRASDALADFIESLPLTGDGGTDTWRL